jgi:non-ribosomal peptide synthetase component F
LEFHLWERKQNNGVGVDSSEGISGFVVYSTDLFDAATITRMLGHFQTLLEGIVANPEQRLADLPILSEAERHQLLVEWNTTQTDYPKNQCIHQLFEAQVEQTPDATALVFEDKHITYRELNIRSNKLAHYLQKQGVGAEVLVGLCVERSPEMVVGMLGILKAGGAYVPLDPSYPPERLSFMLEDACRGEAFVEKNLACDPQNTSTNASPVLLTQQQWVERLGSHKSQVICLWTKIGKLLPKRAKIILPATLQQTTWLMLFTPLAPQESLKGFKLNIVDC